MAKASDSKHKKWHDKKILLLAIAIASVLALSIGLILAAPRQTTAPSAPQETTKSKDLSPQPEAQSQPNNTGSSTGNTTNSKSQTPPTSPPQPATLPNCQYEGGPPSGRNCPASPPASYSTTVSCYGTSTTPITCPDWSYMRRISVDKVDGASYCLFTFWGGGTSDTYYRSKRVKVTNNANPSGYADCSVEQPLE